MGPLTSAPEPVCHTSAVDASRRSLVLVEPSAHHQGGHWGENLARLADHGLPDVRTIAVVPGGLHADVAELVHGRVDEVIEVTTSGGVVGRALLRVATVLEWLRSQLRGRFPGRWWADQPAVVSRFLVEVACLRAARRAAPGPGSAVVVLTANEGLHAAAGLASRTSHQRFVHELSMRQAGWFASIDRWCARRAPKVIVHCPTAGVRRAVLAETPHVDVRVQTFAVSGTLAPPDPALRSRVLTELGLPAGQPVVALLGGWWHYKDHEVVAEAVESLEGGISMVVAGHPVDEEVMARLRRRLGPSIAELGASVSSARYSEICTAADAILISRRPGVDKESGLLMDAVRHGTAVVMSDNDPALVATIGAEPWVHLFRTGDAASLRTRLEALEVEPARRPGADAARRLGMLSPADAVAAFFAVAEG